MKLFFNLHILHRNSQEETQEKWNQPTGWDKAARNNLKDARVANLHPNKRDKLGLSTFDSVVVSIHQEQQEEKGE